MSPTNSPTNSKFKIYNSKFLDFPQFKIYNSKFKISKVFLVLLLAFSFTACSKTAENTKIEILNSSIHLDRSITQSPLQITNEILPTDKTIYATFDFKQRTPVGTKFKIAWWKLAPGKAPSKFKIYEKEIVQDSTPNITAYFSINQPDTTDHLWPLGKYRAQLFVNDELLDTLYFSVVKKRSQPPEPGFLPSYDPNTGKISMPDEYYEYLEKRKRAHDQTK